MNKSDRDDFIRTFIRNISTNNPHDKRSILKTVREELNLPEDDVPATQPAFTNSGRILKFAEAAERLGLSIRWLQKQIMSGRIAAVRPGQRAVGISEAEVERYIRANQTPVHSPASQEAAP